MHQIKSSGFRDWGLGFGVQGLEFQIPEAEPLES